MGLCSLASFREDKRTKASLALETDANQNGHEFDKVIGMSRSGGKLITLFSPKLASC